MKKLSEKSIVMKVENGVKGSIVVETEKMNNTDKLLSLKSATSKNTAVIAHGLDFPVVDWCQSNKGVF